MTAVTAAELLFICFMLLHGFAAALNCSSPTPKALFGALEKDIFPDKLVRPVSDFSKPVNITIGITVIGILGVDEKSQTLTVVLWQVLEWDIAGLSWDERECGTTRVSVPRENLWVPDVIISEFMDENKSPETPYIYLYNTGHVYDDRPMRVVSSCRLVIYTFPFDIQNCSLTFGSYLHFASDVRMIQGVSSEEILKESREVLQTNGEWELADIRADSATLALEDGSYSEIKYYHGGHGVHDYQILKKDCQLNLTLGLIILRRRPTLYVVNLLVPSCFLVTLDLFSFMLPPHSVDRSAFKMTLILGYTVFLLIMNDLLPVTGEQTPIMNVFFSITLALMVASLLETVLITNIQFSSSQYSAVPHWLSMLVLHYLAILVCLPPKQKTNTITVCLNPAATAESVENPSITSISAPQLQNFPVYTSPLKSPSVLPEPAVVELKKLSRDLTAIRHQIDKHYKGTNSSQEWQMIGLVIDRLLFGLYIVFIIVSFITIICIWVWNNSYSV